MPLDIGLDQLGDEVLAGVVGPLGGQLHAVHDQFDRGGESRRCLANSGSMSPTIWFDQSNSFMRSSCGTPIRPGDGLQRKFAGHLLDEVAGSLGRGDLDDVAGPAGEAHRAAARPRAA